MTPTSEELQRRILRGLRVCPLDPFQLAADLQEPPFRVRAELRALRRRRLVFTQPTPDRMLWRLTAAGTELAWGSDQMEAFR